MTARYDMLLDEIDYSSDLSTLECGQSFELNSDEESQTFEMEALDIVTVRELIRGDPGDSAYEVAVANGFDGSEEEWLASLVGPEGPAGRDGQPGKDGYTPVKGVDYFDGEPGEKGDKGDPGYTPVRGKDYWTEADKQEVAEEAAALVPVGVDFVTDETLTLEDGVLRVNTANEVGDYTLPVTAAAVNVTVGNIEVLLKTI